MRLLSILTFLFLFSFTFVTAEGASIGNNNLQFTCTVNYQIPSPSAIYNFSIYYPNGTAMLENKQTTSLGQGSFYYPITFTDAGVYKVKSFCYDGANGNFSDTTLLTVSAMGIEVSSGKATLYLLYVLVSALIMGALIMFGLSISGGNKKDEFTGYIIDVNNLKYLKMFCLGLAYVIWVFISYLNWMIIYSFLDMVFLGKIFQFIFYVSAYLTLPLFILYIYFSIVNLIRDSKTKDSLERGLRVTE